MSTVFSVSKRQINIINICPYYKTIITKTLEIIFQYVANAVPYFYSIQSCNWDYDDSERCWYQHCPFEIIDNCIGENRTPGYIAYNILRENDTENRKVVILFVNTCFVLPRHNTSGLPELGPWDNFSKIIPLYVQMNKFVNYTAYIQSIR